MPVSLDHENEISFINTQFLCQSKIILQTYPTPSNLFYSVPVLPMGNCFRSRSKSGEGPAPPMAGYGPVIRGSCVQGFPCRYYDRRVLDEHFKGRVGAAWRAANGIPRTDATPSGTDAIKSRRTGGLRIALLFLPRRASTTARLLP